MGLCLMAGALVTRLAITSFTLAWTHSVEKSRWEEDWRVTGSMLVIDESRIEGSGAGMEPPDDAVLSGGYWHYRPHLDPLPQVELARGGVVADWQLCLSGSCREIASYLPVQAPRDQNVILRPCPAPSAGRQGAG